MNIQTTRIGTTTAKAQAGSAKANAKATENGEEKRDRVTINVNLEPLNLVTKSAYGAGGAAAGLGLGVITGNVLGRLAGASSLSTIGGAVGVLGGAATALAASNSDKPGETLTEMALNWGGGAVGALGGQFVVGGGLSMLGEATGNQWLTVASPVIGTVSGGLAGSGLLALNGNSELSKNLFTAGLTTGMGTAGLAIGTGFQGIVRSFGSAFGGAASAAPFLAAAAGAGLGVSIAHDEGNNKKLQTAGATLATTTLGYGVGTIVGGVSHAFGGNALYTIGMPLAGAAIGGSLGFSIDESGLPGKEIAQKGAAAVFGGAVGTLGGDLLGHGLSYITGHSIYGNIGAMVGMANGGMVGTILNESENPGALLGTSSAGLGGATAGVVGGAALGSALTFLTGQGIWSVAAPILGGAAGGLTALSATMHHYRGEAK